MAQRKGLSLIDTMARLTLCRSIGDHIRKERLKQLVAVTNLITHLHHLLTSRFPLYFPYFSHCISCVLTTFLLLNEDDDDDDTGSHDPYILLEFVIGYIWCIIKLIL